MSSIQVVHSIDSCRLAVSKVRAQGHSVGFVPTMGALHDGHGSLIAAAVRECDFVVVSIFVNPLQFGASEDLSDYPSTFQQDCDLASTLGADLVFAPDTTEMASSTSLTTVSVAELSQRWEGASRPTHFDGVSTIVTKLFSIVGECKAYFGEKDFQQLAIVRRLAADLSLPVTVVGCPTVRTESGLALSSRNSYLSESQLQDASVISEALYTGKELIESGETDVVQIKQAITARVVQAERLSLDYVAVVDPTSLEPIDEVEGEVRLLIAAAVGETRLIDNLAAALGVVSNG